MEWNILHNICLEHMLCLVENFSLIFEAQGVLMSKQRWVMISEHQQVLFKTFNLKSNKTRCLIYCYGFDSVFLYYISWA